MNVLTELITTAAQSPFVFLVLALLLVVDGFFPVVPGETAVVVLATLGAAGHGPAPLAVLAVAVVATVVGDGIAFFIGRKVGPARWRWMRHPRAERTLRWAAARVERRPGPILVAAKFLPFARVAVTMTAGASALSVKRYLVFSLVAGTVYTAYHVAVATTSGSLFVSNPLIGVAISIGFGVLVAAATAGTRRIVLARRTRSV